MYTLFQNLVNFHSDIAGNYKFVLAMENAVCEEYMTEKRKYKKHILCYLINYLPCAIPRFSIYVCLEEEKQEEV